MRRSVGPVKVVGCSTNASMPRRVETKLSRCWLADVAHRAPAVRRFPTMSTNVTLPALGESVSEGTVPRWLKKVGDTVATDEPLLEVSTDKVDTEIPSPVSGVLLEIKVDVDETAPVGAVLAVIGEP